jgi:hypothetical protein
MSIKLQTSQPLEDQTVTGTTVEHRVKLVSSEIANLWSQYMNDSLAVCFISHSLVHVEDKGVRAVLEFALQLSESHIRQIEQFLIQDHFPVPKGFTNEDLINLQAPALFTDDFLLNYFYVMALVGLTSYAGALGTSVRPDQRKYFAACNTETTELYNKILDVMLQKGVFSRPPHLNPPTELDIVHKQSYLAGWFGKQRPLNAIEMSGIYFNMAKLVVKVVLEIGFAQVAQSKEVRKFFKRGATLCEDQFEVLNTFLADDSLPAPRKWQAEVTNTTVPPFSDKLMLFHVVTLISASSSFYGAGLSVVQRRDLGVQYAKLIAEMGLCAEDGVNLLIEKGWMEQPPTASDRDALMNKE